MTDTLYKALAAVQASIQADKSGNMKIGNRDVPYVEAGAFKELLNGLFQQYGLILIENARPETMVVIGSLLVCGFDFTIVHVETGESETYSNIGAGTTVAPNNINSCGTNALKYLFLNTFLVPTNDGDENNWQSDNNQQQPPHRRESAPPRQDGSVYTVKADAVYLYLNRKGKPQVRIEHPDNEYGATGFTTAVFKEAGYDVSNWHPPEAGENDNIYELSPPAIVTVQDKVVGNNTYCNILSVAMPGDIPM